MVDALDADVLVFCGNMWRPLDGKIIEICTTRRRRPNVLLVLTTFGGDPAVAYRLGRTLQRYYKKFTAFVPGHCKSGGTLVLLGAHELVMAPHAELGPLDAQVRRPDEAGDRTSSLTPTDALRVLAAQSLTAFDQSFAEFRRELLMPSRLAAEIAADFVGTLYSGIFAQIDPMRLGELARATRLMEEYGRRLSARGKNLKDDALQTLISGFPSHDFVIDTEEARELFVIVREPTPDELILNLRVPVEGDTPLVDFLNPEAIEIKKGTPDAEHHPPDPSSDAGAGTTPADVSTTEAKGSQP